MDYERRGRAIAEAFFDASNVMANGAAISFALREAAAEAYENAAGESEKDRIMLLTKAQIADGILEVDHPIIRARAQMRREIAAALRRKAAALRSAGGGGK